MTDEEKRVAELIRKAFHGVTLGTGVGLMEGEGMDDRLDKGTLAKYRCEDEKYDWSAIPVSNLLSCQNSIYFFDPEGMRFHLPAFLIADLDGSLKGMLILPLTLMDHGRMIVFSQLTIAEHNAVREYLLLRLSEPSWGTLSRTMIQNALNQYWTARE